MESWVKPVQSKETEPSDTIQWIIGLGLGHNTSSFLTVSAPFQPKPIKSVTKSNIAEEATSSPLNIQLCLSTTCWIAFESESVSLSMFVCTLHAYYDMIWFDMINKNIRSKISLYQILILYNIFTLYCIISYRLASKTVSVSVYWMIINLFLPSQTVRGGIKWLLEDSLVDVGQEPKSLKT